NPPEGNNRMATSKSAKSTVLCQKYLMKSDGQSNDNNGMSVDFRNEKRFFIIRRIFGFINTYVNWEIFLPKAKL
ncbi:MAG: hypothetical protein AABZ07_03810, partial [Nitrospirota bacterium]